MTFEIDSVGRGVGDLMADDVDLGLAKTATLLVESQQHVVQNQVDE